MAELLSQLPADMNVEYLVLSSTNQEEEDDYHPAPKLGYFASLGKLGTEARHSVPLADLERVALLLNEGAPCTKVSYQAC